MNELSYIHRPVRRSDTIIIVGVAMLLLVVTIIIFGMIDAPAAQSAAIGTEAKGTVNAQTAHAGKRAQ